MKSDTEPTVANDLLIWNEKYYSVRVGHKEFTADKFNDEDYYVLTLAAIARELRREKICKANVFIAAVAERLGDFSGVNMLCDIGNGTMNLLRIVNKKPDAQHMFTEKYGTHQCSLLIREQMMKLHHTALDDTIITEILKKGTADIDGEYLDTVIKTAKEYTTGIFRKLREHEYDPKADEVICYRRWRLPYP